MSKVDIDELVRWRDKCEALAASLQRKVRHCDEITEERDKVVAERDEARASVADAYRRGAEAMRLACQEWCRAWENNGEAIADALADLRVEDKP